MKGELASRVDVSERSVTFKLTELCEVAGR